MHICQEGISSWSSTPAGLENYTYHDAHQTSGENDDTDHRDDPEDTLVCGPSVQKETDGQGQTAGDGEHRRDPDLRFMLNALGLLAFDHTVR